MVRQPDLRAILRHPMVRQPITWYGNEFYNTAALFMIRQHTLSYESLFYGVAAILHAVLLASIGRQHRGAQGRNDVPRCCLDVVVWRGVAWLGLAWWCGAVWSGAVPFPSHSLVSHRGDWPIRFSHTGLTHG